MSNENLRKAKKVKNDEFYTLYEDIENELVHYKPELINKIIYCNCDNPEISNFWKYFVDNFEELKIYKVISTHFNKDNSQSYKIEFNGKEKLITPLKGNGDFKSEECIEILKESDIVITNPPFSLFRDFIKTLMEYKKGFLIIGNINAITKRDIFPYVKNDIIKIGINKIKSFVEPNGNIKKMGNVYWYTTLKNDKVYQPFISLKKYNPDEYQKYDNYDAINVDRVKDIPCDYYGTIGVPIGFIEKYIPSDFTLEDAINRYSILQGVTEETKGKYMTKIGGGTNILASLSRGYELVYAHNTPTFKGHDIYKRIIIRKI